MLNKIPIIGPAMISCRFHSIAVQSLLLVLFFISGCAGPVSQTTVASDLDRQSRGGSDRSGVLLCRGVTVNPAPAANLQRQTVLVGGVELLVVPVLNACLSSGFGYRQFRGRFHKGIDYANNNGGPVFSAGEGRVFESRFHPDYGNMVVVQHSASVFTRYAHLESRRVSVNDSVSQGQMIGKMGKTGNATGIHLHYEILLGNPEVQSPFHFKAIDPFASRMVQGSHASSRSVDRRFPLGDETALLSI